MKIHIQSLLAHQSAHSTNPTDTFIIIIMEAIHCETETKDGAPEKLLKTPQNSQKTPKNSQQLPKASQNSPKLAETAHAETAALR
jgi:hypothetical protein